MDLDDIKRGLRAEIKKRENEQYFTFQCNVRQMCKDVLAKLEEQESVIAEKDKEIRRLRRALYKACANWARSERYTEATWHGDEHREELWAEVQEKCLAMAEKFKEAE